MINQITGKDRSGYTMFEVLVVLAIFTIIATVTGLALFGRSNQNNLTTTAKNIVTLLREAESRSVGQTGNFAWGVHFENSSKPYYALFSTSYSTSTRISYFSLPAFVAYVSSTLAIDATRDVIFNKVTGATASTTIGLGLVSNSQQTITITIGSIGTVTYQ